MLSNFYVLKLLEEAGLPAGVINFVAGDAGLITSELLTHKEFAGVHFTGSTAVSIASGKRSVEISENTDHTLE
ncbi:MAG: hypothetical protein CM1200mP14_15410 [Gammaproteobacteria bacterium]|nr:MAG: hypothetical protein CM1200mP14_15410 [Gammaproteobacteria bacterium]